MILDLQYTLQWWFVFFLIGAIFFPFTSSIFKSFQDLGYSFSKVLGIGILCYLVLVLNILHILPFGFFTIAALLVICLLANILFLKKNKNKSSILKNWRIFLLEEVFFLTSIILWGYIRSFEPSINGLEKFMDFGFVNSILRTTYQPAMDMWLAPLPINYYYFGHLTTAVLTKLSFLPSNITYNLMIATIFAFSFTLSFSIGLNLLTKIKITRIGIIGGIITGLLVSLSGNLHTIYAFFKEYNVDHPVPFWNLEPLFSTFPNAYWYPNATRFIPFTIHEFPIYSFVVSDLHGHVVDIMYVLLLITLSYILFANKGINKIVFLLISLFLSIAYMTNAWDGVIYMMLVFFVLCAKALQENKLNRANVKNILVSIIKPTFILVMLFVLFSLPFSIFFKPFASNIGLLCSPDFLVKIGRIGPLIFEADHCQKSAWWQLLTLYGSFLFFAVSFAIFVFKSKKNKLLPQDLFVFLLILVSSILILVPEIVYLKDIYPAHYRANTMFKLVYQSFIMLSLASGYIIVRIMTSSRNFIFWLVTVAVLFFIFVYPYFAVKSYYAELKTYTGLDGLAYMKTRLPQDYEAINWINTNISGRPVIVEAQGDSYTDYARISANTGLPTILGWTVHEWLWRGTYDIPAPRIDDVRNIYETTNVTQTKNLLKKYNVEYVYVGNLEKEKYPNLQEEKFKKLGKIVFEKDGTRIYKTNY